MLNRVARLVMVLTSLAPMGLVYGAVHFPDPYAILAIGLALASGGLCYVLLRVVEAQGEREALAIERTEMQDKEVLTFLVSYLLPVLRGNTPLDTPGLVVFFVLVLVVLYQSEVLNVNPILGLLGYHFYKATSKSGATYLVITAGKASTLKGNLIGVRITDHVWLRLERQ